MATSNKAIIIAGEDRTLTVQIQDEETGGYYDLTSNTGISVCFKKADGSTLTKTKDDTVTVLSAVAGKIQVVLSDTETALLAVDDEVPFYIMVDVGTTRRIVTSGLERALTVQAKPF